MSIDTLAYAIARGTVTDAIAMYEKRQIASQMGVTLKVVQRMVKAAEIEHRGLPYNGPVDFSAFRTWCPANPY